MGGEPLRGARWALRCRPGRPSPLFLGFILASGKKLHNYLRSTSLTKSPIKPPVRGGWWWGAERIPTALRWVARDRRGRGAALTLGMPWCAAAGPVQRQQRVIVTQQRRQAARAHDRAATRRTTQS